MTVVSPDLKDRYLLPMVGPAAVLSAWGLREVLRAWTLAEGGSAKSGSAQGGARLALFIHWALLAAVAVGLPLVGAWPHGPLRTRGGGPWYPWSLAVPAAAGLGLVVAAGIVLCRRWRGALPAAAVAVMLVAQALAVYGYGRSEDGMSGMKPMADAIRATFPDAVAYYHNPHRRAPNDLSIYLDRPTVQVKDVAQLGPSQSPQVVVLVQRHGGPPPQLPPPWRFVTKVERDRDWLHAFVLPPAEAAAGR
jgi:hypothetical protein